MSGLTVQSARHAHAPRENLIQGLLRGLTLALAHELDKPSGDAPVRHAAWFIANAGFGVSEAEIGAAHGVTKQAVSDAIRKVVDRCDARPYERSLQDVAFRFGVSL